MNGNLRAADIEVEGLSVEELAEVFQGMLDRGRRIPTDIFVAIVSKLFLRGYAELAQEGIRYDRRPPEAYVRHRIQVARSLAKKNDHASVVRLIDMFVQATGTTSGMEQVLLAESSIALGDQDRALEILEQAVDAYPKSALIAIEYGAILLERGAFAKARAALERAAGIRGEMTPRIRKLLVRAYEGMGQIERISENPGLVRLPREEDWATVEATIRAHIDRNEYRLAQDELERIPEGRRKSEPRIIRLMCRVYDGLGQQERTKALLVGLGHGTKKENLVALCAQELLVRSADNDAKAILEKYVHENEGTDPSLLELLSRCYRKGDDTQWIEALLAKAHREFSESADAALGYARLLFMQDQPAMARDILVPFVGGKVTLSLTFLALLSKLYWILEENSKADDLWRWASGLEGAAGEDRLLRSAVMHARRAQLSGDLETARSILDPLARGLGTADPDLVWSMATTYDGLGDPETAEAILARAAKNAPASAAAAQRFANVLFLQGELVAGREILERFIGGKELPDFSLLKLLSEFYSALDEESKADSLWRWAATFDPDSCPTKPMRETLARARIIFLSTVYYKLWGYPNAEDFLRSGGSPVPKLQNARSSGNVAARAGTGLDNGDLDAATSILGYLADDPMIDANAEDLLLLVRFFEAIERPGDAYALLAKTAARFPTDTAIVLEYGLALFERKEFHELISLLGPYATWETPAIELMLLLLKAYRMAGRDADFQSLQLRATEGGWFSRENMQTIHADVREIARTIIDQAVENGPTP